MGEASRGGRRCRVEVIQSMDAATGSSAAPRQLHRARHSAPNRGELQPRPQRCPALGSIPLQAPFPVSVVAERQHPASSTLRITTKQQAQQLPTTTAETGLVRLALSVDFRDPVLAPAQPDQRWHLPRFSKPESRPFLATNFHLNRQRPLQLPQRKTPQPVTRNGQP